MRDTIKIDGMTLTAFPEFGAWYGVTTERHDGTGEDVPLLVYTPMLANGGADPELGWGGDLDMSGHDDMLSTINAVLGTAFVMKPDGSVV